MIGRLKFSGDRTMYAGQRDLGLDETTPSSQVAAQAISGGGLVVCPVMAPAFVGFGQGHFLAIYRMAYAQALAALAAKPTLYDHLQSPCWN